MKTLLSGFGEVPQDVVKIVNHICANATTSKSFTDFVKKVGLILNFFCYTWRIRRLSPGKVLNHLI